MTDEVAALGDRLRAARQARGLSLRALAEQVGVSASMVWQIEAGRSRPSVSTLYALTTALGLSVEDVFTPATARTGTGIEDGGTPLPTEDVGAGAGPADAASWLGPVVHPDERPCLALDSGVTWQRLGRLPGRATDFLLITYPPAASSSSSGGLMRHSGHEYGYLLSGELVVTLGFEEQRLAPGDAVSFESSTPHRYGNEGEQPAVGVWFVVD